MAQTASRQTFSLQPSKYHQSLPTEFYNLTVFYQDPLNGHNFTVILHHSRATEGVLCPVLI